MILSPHGRLNKELPEDSVRNSRRGGGGGGRACTITLVAEATEFLRGAMEVGIIPLLGI